MKQKNFIFMAALCLSAWMPGVGWGQETGSHKFGYQVSGEEGGYEVIDNVTDDNKITFTQDGEYTITGNGTKANYQIVVSEDKTVTITLSGVDIDAQLNDEMESGEGEKAYPDHCAFEINSGAKVTLKWDGDNKLWSGGNRAGINVKPNATLILADDGQGTLEAGSYCNTENGEHTRGAGIGGDENNPSFGDIIIENGKITAISQARAYSGTANTIYADGAGIGGGLKVGQGTSTITETSATGTILIKGGEVTAKCEAIDNIDATFAHGAGIGGGCHGTCERITILGGTVNATSESGNDIGVGYEYTASDHPEIIIGKWDDKTKTKVTGTVDNTNYLDGDKGTVKGTVTIPEGTQIYMENFVPELSEGKLNAYNVELSQSKITEDGTCTTTAGGEYKSRINYYLGKNATFNQPNVACSNNHLFMGWVSVDAPEGKKIFVAGESGAIFVLPDADITGIKKYVYYQTWVDNEYPIVVSTGTTWENNGEKTPKVYVAGPGEDGGFLLNNLHFEITDKDGLDGLTGFYQNQLLGTVTLPEETNHLEATVKASVKLGETDKVKEVLIPITVVERALIQEVSKSSTSHVYTGSDHNAKADDIEHLLTVKMNKFADGTSVSGGGSILTEGIHYRIFKYTLKGKEYPAPASPSKESVKLTQAGTYTNITIEALDATISESLSEDHTYYTLREAIEIAQRPMNVTFELPKKITDQSDVVLDDIVIFEKQGEGKGLVSGEDDYKLSGKVEFTPVSAGSNQYNVTIKGFKIEDGEKFKVSNYDIKINGDEAYVANGDIDLGTVTIDDNSGSGIINYNDLILLESEGAKLSSRHNKMRVKDGGSFTVSLEKEEGYEDCEPTVYIRRGRYGEWKELKIDEVSNYYQIRNVYSDIYVKVSGDGIWPVSNEQIAAQDVKVYVQNGKLVVVTPQPTDVQVVSMTGALVAIEKVTGQHEFANLAEGVYIVRAGETTVKVRL